MRRRVVTVVVMVVVVAIVALAAAGALVWRQSSRAPSPITPVDYLGDSITDQARELLQSRLGADPANIKAVGGATIDQMMGPAQELAATHPAQVVINLGTNDVAAGEPTDSNVASLERMVSLFPDARCLHLVTINNHMVSTRPTIGALADALNDRIHAMDSDPRIRVIDWAQIVDDYDAAHDPNGPITMDTVHPTALGQTMLLDAYQRSLDSC